MAPAADFPMTAAASILPRPAASRVPLLWGLSAYVWVLPLHSLLVAFLFGALGWSAPLVRSIAAWKEGLIALLLALAAVRVATGAGPAMVIRWLDLAVGGLVAVAFAYLVGAGVWFAAGLPAGAQLYGFRDAAFVTALYFVGRATPEAAESPRPVQALFLVGVATSAIAILERLFVGPDLLVLLGAARYVQDFLGGVALTTGNVYGLPDNYWTLIGDHLVRRVGSTYLSAQGFAIPFLLIVPAATLWVTAAARRAWVAAWLGYGVIWSALLLTVTRLTIVACLVQAALIFAARRRWGALLAGGIGAVLVFLALLAAVPGLAGFVWDTLTWQSGSSASHLEDWQQGLENLLRYPLGVGLGGTDQNAIRFGVTPFVADNQYLRFAVELGIPGLLLHLAVLAGAGAAGLSAWRRGGSPPVRDAGLLVAATAMGIALNGWTAAVLTSMLLAYVFWWLAGSVVTATPPLPGDEHPRRV